MKKSTKIVILTVSVTCAIALAVLCFFYFETIVKTVRKVIKKLHKEDQKIDSISFDLENI